jgi:predicted dehydrogenase
MTKRRIVVAGLGSIGKRHARLLLEGGDVAVEVVEPNREALAAAQDSLGPLHAHESFDAALDTRPDVVWICTPTRLHADQTIAALGAGAHVFCEKPMSGTLADALRMQEAADRASTVLAIGFYLHFWHGIARIKELVDAGCLGEVLHAHARVGSYTTLVNSVSRYQAENPGSLFFDYSHQPDLFCWLLGRAPESVWVAGFEGGRMEFSSAPNLVDIVCRYAGNLISTVHLNYVQLPERHEYEVVGTRGWAHADFFASTIRIGARAGNRVVTETFTQERDDIFRAEHRAFFDAVEGRREPETSAYGGLVSTAICEAAVQSWRTRQEVPLGVSTA